MAEKPASKIPRKRRKVKAKKRRMTSDKRGKKPRIKAKKKAKKRAKKARKKAPLARTLARKKKTGKRPSKKPSKKALQQALDYIREHPGEFPTIPIVPKKTGKAPADVNWESVAAQVADRIRVKIIMPGFTEESVESQIMAALIAAEQTGTINDEYYSQAELHGWEPQEVYQLWIYN